VSFLDVDRRWPGKPAWRLVASWIIPTFFVRCAFRLFYRVRWTGVENVPRTGAFILVSNHVSHFDPPLVGCRMKDRPCSFLARASLFDVPVFGALIRFVNAVPLHREGNPGKALRAAIEELKAGRCVIMFPEGTRSKDGRVGAFKAGMMLLVRRAKASIVPVAVDGPFEIWPSSRSRPRLGGRIDVRYGTPIPAEELLGLDTGVALDRLREAIRALAGEEPIRDDAEQDDEGGAKPPQMQPVGQAGAEQSE